MFDVKFMRKEMLSDEFNKKSIHSSLIRFSIFDRVFSDSHKQTLRFRNIANLLRSFHKLVCIHVYVPVYVLGNNANKIIRMT